MLYDTVIVRYGEIFLKSSYVRKQFEGMLLKNMEAKMRREQVAYRIYCKRHRFYVKSKQVDRVCAVLRDTFGVVSVSPAKEVSSRREDVVSACLELAKDVVRPGESFAVRVQRTGVHGYRSMDIEAEAGARILEAIPAHVDLENPGQTIYAEIRDDAAYIYSEK